MNAHGRDTTHTEALGQVIAERRNRRALSIRALAAAAGIGRRQLAQIERGEPHAQRLDALWALADALQTPLSIIFDEAERRADALHVAQRAVVLALLESDAPVAWTPRRLQRRLCDIDPVILAAALAQLHATGVICRREKEIHAREATWRLERLGMLSI